MSQTISWYDFSFRLPDHWEVTRYSIAEPTGRFEFMDRNGALGRLSWEHSKRMPDEERILTEYHRRYLQDFDEHEVTAFAGIRTKRIGRFMVGYRSKGEPCQALLYLPEARKVLLWVFPDYSEIRMKELWTPILESFEKNDSDYRKWSAFGISCSLPKDFEIENVKCSPGDVWFEFQHSNMHRVDIHRWGLPRELLRNSNMDEFIRRVISHQEGRILTSKRSNFRGMDSHELTTEIRGTKGMDRLFSSYWHGVGRIWHNDAERRIYAYFQAGPKNILHIPEDRLFPI